MGSVALGVDKDGDTAADEAGKGQSLVDAMHKENEGKESGAAGADAEGKGGDTNTKAKDNQSQDQDQDDVEAKFKHFEISGENIDEIRETGTNVSDNKSDKNPKVPSNPRF